MSQPCVSPPCWQMQWRSKELLLEADPTNVESLCCCGVRISARLWMRDLFSQYAYVCSCQSRLGMSINFGTSWIWTREVMAVKLAIHQLIRDCLEMKVWKMALGALQLGARVWKSRLLNEANGWQLGKQEPIHKLCSPVYIFFGLHWQ